MEQFHGRDDRKRSGSGGRKRIQRHPKLHEVGGAFTATKAGSKDANKAKRVRGGNAKVKLKKALHANVVTPNGVKKTAIRTVLETPSNKHFARQNIIVKGAIIDTELGKVRVTNRVGQDGIVNGVLLAKKIEGESA